MTETVQTAMTVDCAALRAVTSSGATCTKLYFPCLSSVAEERLLKSARPTKIVALLLGYKEIANSLDHQGP